MPEKIPILYVDDEPDLLEIGRQFLETLGDFTVNTAESVADAKAMLINKPFDVIVSDYQMPGTNGIEFLKYVRQQYPDTPFILFTGRGREEVVIEAINNGAEAYLQKALEHVNTNFPTDSPHLRRLQDKVKERNKEENSPSLQF